MNDAPSEARMDFGFSQKLFMNFLDLPSPPDIMGFKALVFPAPLPSGVGLLFFLLIPVYFYIREVLMSKCSELHDLFKLPKTF